MEYLLSAAPSVSRKTVFCFFISVNPVQSNSLCHKAFKDQGIIYNPQLLTAVKKKKIYIY